MKIVGFNITKYEIELPTRVLTYRLMKSADRAAAGNSNNDIIFI